MAQTLGLTDLQVADQIRADGIDILVDLALHTGNNRLLVFARKPAPVQVAMLGMVTTTGLATIDYRLSDPYLDPPGPGDRDYTERTVRLPHGCWCYQPPEGTPPVGVLPALEWLRHLRLPEPFLKGQPAGFQVWLTILQSLPGARLVIHSQPGAHLEAVRALFQKGGIARDRVEFLAGSRELGISSAITISTSASIRSPTTATPPRSIRSGWEFRSSRWPAARRWDERA